MTKLEHFIDGEWVEHCWSPMFAIQRNDGSPRRVVATLPQGDPSIVQRLLDCMTPPFFLLYVLHTPRGEGEPGRYQSRELSRAEVDGFFEEFGSYLQNDGRSDLWIYSIEDQATLVWDRHNLLYGYRLADCFASKLSALGYIDGEPVVSFPHAHNYRTAFDPQAAALLAADFNWLHSPLQPEDEQ